MTHMISNVYHDVDVYHVSLMWTCDVNDVHLYHFSNHVITRKIIEASAKAESAYNGVCA